ncbi:MAG: indolepyruvate oxidoreductase subunit beta [Lentisphaerae bacterium]|jgi:indolepyruvate ferredoxin oxidoreductase, beta subunit|nr:indolepyruvate oxidoreductase subunit beta [Lentisphaerota bacterium]MBT5606517.1 indolepyruvate oxidoreductase subunit beta [Lentisphaerota bacterium]MBT7060152.1 indolepyruvate oxidoreductase subunit beta [Lentisphaerota bacterium]MBT7845329.1 indolepyruvate oxidoreductase subunit beta [Lentisphaerota bacterium]
MKNDIVIAGVGGQGILTIAAIVGHAAVANGLNVKQSEVHGMAQRGGAVLAHLRISDDVIYSDLVPKGKADVVLAVEPLEALRHIDFLAPDGVVLANEVPVVNIDNYPDLETVLAELRQYPRRLVLDADQVAKNTGSARAMNMVMLGALSPFLDLPDESLTDMIKQAFERKGEKVLKTNLEAFTEGQQAAETVADA